MFKFKMIDILRAVAKANPGECGGKIRVAFLFCSSLDQLEAAG
jgi:hypothetical protein